MYGIVELMSCCVDEDNEKAQVFDLGKLVIGCQRPTCATLSRPCPTIGSVQLSKFYV